MAVTEHGVKIVAELDTSKVQAQLGGGSGGGGSGGGVATSSAIGAIVGKMANQLEALKTTLKTVNELGKHLSPASIAKIAESIKSLSSRFAALDGMFKSTSTKFQELVKSIYSATLAFDNSTKLIRSAAASLKGYANQLAYVQSKKFYNDMIDNFAKSEKARQFVRHGMVDLASAAHAQGLNGEDAVALGVGMTPQESAALRKDRAGQKTLHSNMNGGNGSPLAHAKVVSGALLFGNLMGDLTQGIQSLSDEGSKLQLGGMAGSAATNILTSMTLGAAINPVFGILAALASAGAEAAKAVKAFGDAVKSVSESLEKGITIQEDATFKQGLKSKGTDFLDKEYDKAQKQLEYYNKARDAAFKELQASTSLDSKLGTFEKAAAAKSWTSLMEKYQKEVDKQQNRLNAIEKRREELSKYDDESWWIENRGVAEEKEWWSGEKIRLEEEKKRKAVEDERYAHLGEMRSIRIQGEAAREQVAQALLKGNPNEWKGIASIEQDFGRQKLSSFDLINELEEKLLQERDTDKRRELANRLSEEQARYSTAESILKMIPVEKQIEWLGLGNMTSLAAKGGMMGEKDNTARMWNKLEKIVDELDSIRMNTADQRWSTFR